MEAVFEIFIELFGGMLLQAVGQMLASLGIHWNRGGQVKDAKLKNGAAKNVKAKDHQPAPTPPWLGAIAYALSGAVAGGISLWIRPNSAIHLTALRIAYLVLAPLLIGAMFAMVARWRHGGGSPQQRVDRFACGWLFALALAAVRFVFTH